MNFKSHETDPSRTLVSCLRTAKIKIRTAKTIVVEIFSHPTKTSLIDDNGRLIRRE